MYSTIPLLSFDGIMGRFTDELARSRGIISYKEIQDRLHFIKTMQDKISCQELTYGYPSVLRGIAV